MKEMVDYVLDERKTREELCHTSGVTKQTAYEDMVFIKQLFGKTEGREYLHWVLSHDKGVSDNVADAVALEVLQLLQKRYQIVLATHINTENVHTHFLINTVDITSGRKFSESVPDMLKFREKINQILETHGLNTIGTIEEFDEDTEDDIFADSNTGLSDNDEMRVYISNAVEDTVDCGVGSVEDGNIFTPGIYYSQNVGGDRFIQGNTWISGVTYDSTSEGLKANKGEQELIPGVTYEAGPVKVRLEEEEGTFFGKMCIENNRILYPGVLYEAGN